DSGTAGSYARFITVGDFLYIVDNENIQTFNVSDPSLPNKVDEQSIGSQIESIFNFQDKLFIGSGQGLFIYTIPANGVPTQAAAYNYDFPILPCDPVVANSQYAYVTLSTTIDGGPCSRNANVNELKIFDVSDVYNPIELTAYPMNEPKGVGLDGNTLFVCDGYAGLKVYDVSDPLNIQLINSFENFYAFDVIPLDGLLLCVSDDNVYQYDYSNLNNIQQISNIPIQF
ncbi:MAG: LVIVD repeat-containing protein, partial [Saprospiraceae bacterium]